MLDLLGKDFVVGETPVPREGRVTDQERKSPPLSALLPNRDAYLRAAPDNHFRADRVELEWDRLWTRTWICAGRTSDVASKGQWFRFDLGRESFIISRSDDDTITAMFNVCQHRANRLVDDNFGRTSAFVCPYHSWRYDRAGKCTNVTDRELFKPAALAGKLDLPTVRCETWNGFVFINMDENAKPLADYIGEVDDILSAYHMERLEVRADIVVDLDCNWKTILDAFSENYHVHITHPGAAVIAEDKYAQVDFYANGHTRRIVPVGNSGKRRGAGTVLHPAQAEMLKSVGIDPAGFVGTSQDVRRSMQIAKRAMAERAMDDVLGQAYRELSDGQLTDDWAMNVFPNMHLSIHAEGALWMRYLPHRSDPAKCRLHVATLAVPGVPFDFYAPEAEELEPSGRPVRQYVSAADPGLQDKIGQLLWEDLRNTRETQLGLQSRGFKEMRLSEHEQPIMYQYAEIDKYLEVE